MASINKHTATKVFFTELSLADELPHFILYGQCYGDLNWVRFSAGWIGLTPHSWAPTRRRFIRKAPGRFSVPNRWVIHWLTRGIAQSVYWKSQWSCRNRLKWLWPPTTIVVSFLSSPAVYGSFRNEQEP